MNIKKLAAIRRVAADEINATSIQPETVVKLCDEIIAATKRAETAEARVKELESQLAGLLPAAQVVVTAIEFIPIPASNAAADSALLTGTGETSNGGMWKQVESATHP